MLYRIVWNGTVFMLNWIFCIGTVFDMEALLMLNWIVWNITVWLEMVMFLTIKQCTDDKLSWLKPSSLWLEKSI